jgi:hypothetical protein
MLAFIAAPLVAALLFAGLTATEPNASGVENFFILT